MKSFFEFTNHVEKEESYKKLADLWVKYDIDPEVFCEEIINLAKDGLINENGEVDNLLVEKWFSGETPLNWLKSGANAARGWLSGKGNLDPDEVEAQEREREALRKQEAERERIRQMGRDYKYGNPNVPDAALAAKKRAEYRAQQQAKVDAIQSPTAPDGFQTRKGIAAALPSKVQHAIQLAKDLDKRLAEIQGQMKGVSFKREYLSNLANYLDTTAMKFAQSELAKIQRQERDAGRSYETAKTQAEIDREKARLASDPEYLRKKRLERQAQGMFGNQGTIPTTNERPRIDSVPTGEPYQPIGRPRI